jgi:hypothetical protein
MKETKRDSKIVPVGPGGMAGKVMRIAMLVGTAGFAYPNVFIEGMDMNELHRKHMQNAERRSDVAP